MLRLLSWTRGAGSRGLWLIAGAAALLAIATPAHAAPSVYVTNYVGGTVSQYDVGPGGALLPKSPATVPAGTNPFGVAVTPDGGSVYVANGGGGVQSTVSQYDVGSGGALSPKSPATVPAGRAASGVAVSPDGRSVYVVNSVGDGTPIERGTVSQFDVGPGGALSPKSPATVPAGLSPDWVAVSPDGGSVYVVNGASDIFINQGGTVSQYDVGPGGALSPKSPATVPAGLFPEGVAVSRDGGSVYVANSSSATVAQYHVGPGGVLSPSPATVPVPNPSGVAVSPEGGSVYVTSVGGTISQFDVGPGGALLPKSPATVPAGRNPIGVAVTPDGHAVYVANNDSDNVSQYDVGPGGALLPKSPATVPAGQDPLGVAVSPLPRVPTSKEQCKNGGWRNYGDTFRNQGQCVAFVERGPKP